MQAARAATMKLGIDQPLTLSYALDPRAAASASRGEAEEEKPRQPGPTRVQVDQCAGPEPQAERLGASDRLRPWPEGHGLKHLSGLVRTVKGIRKDG